MPAHGQIDTTTQTQLQRHPDGSVTTWQFDVMNARECLARYIAQTDQPISIGESPFYKELITSAYNPQYEPVSRTTIINDLIRLFETERDDLVAEIQHLSVSVALTSDIWNACSKQDYLCVTGHYLDSDWRITKRIFGFRPMDFAHTAENIFNVIMEVLETYEITHRILSIPFDNVSANTSSIALFVARNIPQDGGYFFHQRCACHIINLVVQAGLKHVSDQIDRIRDAISWIYSSNPRFSEFKRHCKLNGLKPRRFQTDMSVRWNSTYLMLQNFLEYDTTITCFYNMKLTETGQLSPKLLSTDDWFGNIDIPQSTRPETEPKQTSWSLLKRRKKDKSESTSSGQRSSPSSCTELIRYLEAQFDAVEDKEEFDLLLWWKPYTYRYPVLSHLARGVLVIPVSTVSSEQAFSTSGRIIEPRRSCLSPEMVEVLTCLRDWEHAKKRPFNWIKVCETRKWILPSVLLLATLPDQGLKLQAKAKDEFYAPVDPPKVEEKLGAVLRGLSTDSDVVKRSGVDLEEVGSKLCREI
ncbi:hypothetical protein Ddye_005185 [Dipteronia dyeriana]|uniref:HAT C-terminal dimerisation domain-containing protein n=1 Tax=Dipteronia dyeriana TaxID=168575 RepID=A0AAD9XG64_9ROSI|nr:hypothetical protein Ddye_005185 [Dipteronia dyeriana]